MTPVLVEVIRDEESATVRVVLDHVSTADRDAYRVADLVWSAVSRELLAAGMPGVDRC